MIKQKTSASLAWLSTSRGKSVVTVWLIVLLMSGQGFRFLLGLPAFGVLVALTIAAVVLSFRTPWGKLKIPHVLMAFVGLAVLSIGWSATRPVTILASLVMVLTTYVAVVTVRGHSNVRFMELLYRGLQISLLGGLLFELVVATLYRSDVFPVVNDLTSIAGTSPDPWSENNLFAGGPIQGFVGNRNPFGAIALFTAIVAFILMLEKRISRTDALLTLAAAGAVHLLTMSATVSASAIYIVVLAVAGLIIRAAPASLKRVLSFTVLGCTAAVAILTLKYRDLIFGLFDRGGDVTNRTELWHEVIAYAMQRPEGWGFVGYWPVWESPYKNIVDDTGVFATHAHNAYLDSWLQLGLIGLALIIVIVVLLFGSTWRLVERAGRGDTFIPLGWAMLTGAMAIQALTESRMLVEGGWFLLVALYCMGPQVFTLTLVDPDLVHAGTKQRIDAKIAFKEK
ncbi:O-antigen ligase family protein [Demequina aurantiaca]|uniref:O-antigen ligase family protein n=1 Tax=Demequina aurantiaca TaxID=676200 RepID=UPI003D352D84